MAGFTVLRDVGETLKKLLKDNISELSDESSILFDSPADIEPTTTKLSIFLYQIVENSHLRNSGPVPINTDKMQYPPLTLDLLYLFTPYAQNRETEFIILERLMQIFHDKSVLRQEMLQGNLMTSGNDEIRVIPNSLTLEELNKLWGTFPNKAFKLSASYMLTPVRIPSERKIDIKRVEKKDIDMYRWIKKDDKKIFLERIEVKKKI